MKFEVYFRLKNSEIATRDYRRVFTSIIKSALSVYMDGKAKDKFYKDTQQKNFTWSIFFNKPKFGKDKISLEGSDVKMLFSTWDADNTGYIMYSAFNKIKNKPLPLPNGNEIVLQKIVVLNQKIIEKNSCIFKTVTGSPVVVREHNAQSNRDRFYTSTDIDFNAKLTDGLIRQAKQSGFADEITEKIRARALNCEKNVVYNYGIYLDANVGLIEIQAEPIVLQYFYQCGIMAHRSQCFGMLDLVAQTNKEE